MGSIELKEPIPLAQPMVVALPVFPAASVIFLERPAKLPETDFNTLSIRRRSAASFPAKLDLKSLSALLWLALRDRRAHDSTLKSKAHGRPFASAGACYPINFLMLNVPSAENTSLIYDARHHALKLLPEIATTRFKRALGIIEKCRAVGNGTVILFLGDVDRVRAKYKEPESLLWRDAGCALATLHLAATSLDLAFCPLGIHGNSAVTSLLGKKHPFVGLGGAIVGRAPGTKQS